MIRLFTCQSPPELVWENPVNKPIIKIFFSPDSRHLITQNKKKILQVWDLQEKELVYEEEIMKVEELKFDRDMEYAYFIFHKKPLGLSECYSSYQLQIWDAAALLGIETVEE